VNKIPNWCIGNVNVKGTPRDIERFCRLFLFEDDKPDKKQYFARSFIHETWKDFKEENLKNNDGEVNFMVDFAWSVHSCLIDGYPTDENHDKHLITLSNACKKFNVSVHIESEETGMCFEEEIDCSELGELEDSCIEMPTYVCSCGNKQQFPSSYSKSELEDEECWECNKIGEWKNEI